MNEQPPAQPPRFMALEAILMLGVGFVLHPLVEAIARRDWIAAGAGIAYLVIAWRRIAPRLDSLSEFTYR